MAVRQCNSWLTLRTWTYRLHRTSDFGKAISSVFFILGRSNDLALSFLDVDEATVFRIYAAKLVGLRPRGYRIAMEVGILAGEPWSGCHLVIRLAVQSVVASKIRSREEMEEEEGSQEQIYPRLITSWYSTQYQLQAD